MNPVLGFIEGLREILANKFRSFLTISGVILGVAALMAMFAITAGMAAGFRKTLIEVGGIERVRVSDSPVPVEQEAIRELSPGRTYRDVMALRASAPLLTLISPEQGVDGATIMSFGGKSTDIRLVGVEREFLDSERHVIARGRFLADLDQENASAVCVIGNAVVTALFDGDTDAALGSRVRINDQPYRVVGIFKSYDIEFKDQAVAIPFRTMQETFNSAKVVNGTDQGPTVKLRNLSFTVADIAQFNAALQQARNVMDITHRGIADFGFNTREDWFDYVEGAVRGAALSGGIIAAVSLIVGGVGITNIMLASIKQRIREIGIRLAVGARGSDIFLQIVMEAIVLSILGGLLGLAAGWLLVQFIREGLTLLALNPADIQNLPFIETRALLISFGAAVAVGVLAGLYPAWRASRLHPIDALKYE